jgi:integrase
MSRALETLTDRHLAALGPQAGKQVEHPDPMTPGLALRITGAGRKSWTFRYRSHEGRQSRVTFGRFPTIKLRDARGLAQDVLSNVRKGGDPARERRLERHRESVNALRTWNDLAERYFVERGGTKRSTPRERQLWKARFEKPVGQLTLPDLGRAQVRALIRQMGEGGAPKYANRAHALIRQIGNFGVEVEALETNPAHGIRKQFEETTRERVLAEQEIAALWAQLEFVACTRPMALAIRFLLATGQRRGEVAGLHARELNLAERVWIIPSARTKNKREHVVPLSDLAMKLLAQAFFADLSCSEASFAGWAGYAFTAAPDRSAPLDESSVSHAVMRAAERMGLENIRTHDLRRTCATYMTSEGIGATRDTVARVLNHVSAVGGVTAIYDRNAYAKEKRTALQAWGEQLVQISLPDRLDITTGTQ